jgi:hypothetical protein
MSELLVTMRDLRACHTCGRGALKFFNSHPDLRRALIKEGGIPISKMDALGDAMADMVAAYVRGKNGRQ